jgi:chloramphenicol-sensitive protein RarD
MVDQTSERYYRSRDLKPSHDEHTRARAGLMYGLGAYLFWGLVPAFFKLLAHVPPVVVLSHRVTWSVVVCVALLAIGRRWDELRPVLRSRRMLLSLAASTLLVAGNWFFFIVAVSTNRVLQSSFGYFITPLFSVGLGMMFLNERLRRWQGVALACAIAGVFVMAGFQGQVPWLALGMATTFSLYGLVRKITPVAPLIGLTVETLLLLPLAAPVAAGYVIENSGTAGDARTYALLVASGLITAVPLLWFAAAAHRLTLATLGFLQYVGPTCQFLLAVFVYGEAFTATHAASFGLIWLAVAVYAADTWRAGWRTTGVRTEYSNVPPPVVPVLPE